MATIFRLGSRRILDQIIQHEKVGFLSLVRPVTLKPQPFVPPKDIGYDEHNMKLSRPQSPHLSIYAPQLTWTLSITHRATGMALAGYTILFGIGSIALPDSIPSYLQSLEEANVSQALLYGAKFSLAFPFAFHFWNGIRHLFWDIGWFLSLKEVYFTGYVSLILTTGSAVGLTVL